VFQQAAERLVTYDVFAVERRRRLRRRKVGQDRNVAEPLMETRGFRVRTAAVEASKGKSFWTNFLINTLDLLTTPPQERVREMPRRQGGSWVPGEEL
jgi:hypothetical protein